jgi:diadenosine tetraphosphate (Ap4A) HIT family hydrolase
MIGCFFCCFLTAGDGVQSKISPILYDSDHWYVMYDRFPVTNGHTLLVTKTHHSDFFTLSEDEVLEFYSILRYRQNIQKRADPTIKGFNVGMNCGEVAGQTVMHCHVHLIPRRKGDVENPRGGIRHVIPGKGNY